MSVPVFSEGTKWRHWIPRSRTSCHGYRKGSGISGSGDDGAEGRAGKDTREGDGATYYQHGRALPGWIRDHAFA